MNIIEMFARGNQELFHSAFIAWLLNNKGQHGLGSRFRNALLPHARIDARGVADAELEVLTEHAEGRLRFDILIRPRGNAPPQWRGLVLENKIKSFGAPAQLDSYERQGYSVAALALLPETLDERSRQRYPVIEYQTLCGILEEALQERDTANGDCYGFLIREYLSFIHNTLGPYNALRQYCHGEIDSNQLRETSGRALAERRLTDNDIRTFTYFYYESFHKYLQMSARDLIFGEFEYAAAETENAATRWYRVKNQQGSPFMECIMYGPGPHGHFTPDQRVREFAAQQPFQIAPRIELWLDLKALADVGDEKAEVRKMMLGSWNHELMNRLRIEEPFRTALRGRGSRNFHSEALQLGDLVFPRFADRIRGMLRLVGTLEP